MLDYGVLKFLSFLDLCTAIGCSLKTTTAIFLQLWGNK